MMRRSWFETLRVVQQEDEHRWLADLPSPIRCIADFGCWSGCEPLALLWTLDAQEIAVVEIEQKFLSELEEQISISSAAFPDSLRHRKVNPICRDMARHIPELGDAHFDLVYCKDVLYALPLHGDPEALGRAIDQMVRILRPEGFLVVVEPKFGVRFEIRESGLPGLQIALPVPISDPVNMSPIFASKGLIPFHLPGQPPYCYCHRKPVN